MCQFINCLICESRMEYYFSKEYIEKPYSDYMKEIGKVDYYRCKNCGFVISRTHIEMENVKWEKLNDIHHYFEKQKQDTLESEKNESPNPPPYLQQAAMINLLQKNGILSQENILDFAGGYGTLQNILEKYYNIFSLIYDPFVNSPGKKYVKKEELGKYKTVLNSAMFEHIRNRNDLDNVNRLVDEDGSLIIHTVICENIPKDGNWFYINPVHCAFHTNKSMDILMNQWGYISSIYCPTSKCWVFFKKEPNNLTEKIININVELQEPYLYYKKGFVDYWKGF